MSTITGRDARLAFWFAVVLGLLGLVTAWSDPVVGMFEAATFFAVAWGIARGHSGAAIAGACSVLTVLVLAAFRWHEVLQLAVGQPATTLASITVLLALVWFLARAALELAKSPVEPPRWPWLLAACSLFAAALTLRPVAVTAGSMEDTILPGDQILVETLSARFGRLPRRGEIVCLRFPVDNQQIFIKRVTGVPGERLAIRGKRLYVNGSLVNEPYACHKTVYIDPYRDNFPGIPTVRIFAEAAKMLDFNVRGGEVLVPPGKYFVLGDNRDNSLDSRYWGFISAGDIVGRPFIIYGSFDGTPSLANTRWKRLLRMF